MSEGYLGCKLCRGKSPLDFGITMAFQPIIDIEQQSVFAYEALVRGKNGESAGEILSKITDDNRYQFDQICRTTAIKLAARSGVSCLLSINFLPNAVCRSASNTARRRAARLPYFQSNV